MKTAQKTVALLIAAASLAIVGVSGSTGCAAFQENTGSSSADLLTPIPLFHSVASKDTQKALNIYSWRVYRGKHEYTVTGYDATGHAVSGFAIGAYGHTNYTKSHLRARMLDGTKAVIRPVFGGASTSTGALSAKSTEFINRAMTDFSAIRSDVVSESSTQSMTFGGSSTGLHFLGSPTADGGAGSATCTTALLSMLTDSMACGAAMAKTPGATAASIPTCMKSVTDIAAVETACVAATAAAGGKSDAGAGSGSGGSSGGSKPSGGSGSGGGGGKDSGGGGNNNSGGNNKPDASPGNGTPDASTNNNNRADASTNTQDASPDTQPDASPGDQDASTDPDQSEAGPDDQSDGGGDPDPDQADGGGDPDPDQADGGGADDPEQCTDDTTCASQTDQDSTDQTCESCPAGTSSSADTSESASDGDVSMGEDTGDDDYSADDEEDDTYDDSYKVHATTTKR